MAKPLSEYNRKRDFEITAEPSGKATTGKRKDVSTVVRDPETLTHATCTMTFRLELDGVSQTWAVPRGPSLDPSQKRLAVHVEDHPAGLR